MTRAILAALLCATAAGAQDRHEWTSGNTVSFVEIAAPSDPACIALVRFHDAPVHTGLEDFALHRDGLTVDFRIVYNGAGPGETVYIAPPMGFYARPDTLTPGEHETAEAHICPLGVAS